MKYFLPLLAFLFIAGNTRAQIASDYAVQVYASTQINPTLITLHWLPLPGATAFTIYKKLKTDNSWGSVFASLPGTDSTFIDTAVTKEISYEYKLVCTGNVTAYGYINSGINIPETDYRGKIVLVVDTTLSLTRNYVNSTFINDLVADGYDVLLKEVSRTTTIDVIKQSVVDEYNQDPANVKSVLLVGHVAVPYSGDINPDGHADHKGAWPADVYYGDMDGNWTDNSVNDTTASGVQNDNTPGDGKFDQSLIPSDIELQVGRVDLYKLTAFTTPEDSLVYKYLVRDHNFRRAALNISQRALIDDNFGAFSGEAFAASGWKNFAPLVAPDMINETDYFTELRTKDYVWSYGCGGGSYTSCSGVGTTTDFATAPPVNTIFTMLFGSYFGDWNTQNNFLRAPLADGALTSCWSGRPHWYFHHMGLGETVGYGALLTENNNALYYQNYGGRFVDNALMGDPTLTQFPVIPPTNLTATVNHNTVTLSWSASADADLGYSLYRKDGPGKPFTKIGGHYITGTTYTDMCLDTGSYTYMVRAVKLQTTPSGTFVNLSSGINTTATATAPAQLAAGFTPFVNADTVSLVNTTTGADAYYWGFGDGTFDTAFAPVHVYDSSGTYIISFTATNNCNSQTITDTVTVIVSGVETVNADKLAVQLMPNPFKNQLSIFTNQGNGLISYKLFDATGRLLLQETAEGSRHIISTSQLAQGMYILQLQSATSTASFSVLKQ